MLARATGVFKSTLVTSKKNVISGVHVSSSKGISPSVDCAVSKVAPTFGSLQQQRSFHVSALMLAVPKKRQSHSRSRIRRHNTCNQLLMKHFTHYHKCKNCNKTTLRHNVCTHCGWYKGQAVTLKARRKAEKQAQKLATSEAPTTTDV